MVIVCFLWMINTLSCFSSLLGWQGWGLAVDFTELTVPLAHLSHVVVIGMHHPWVESIFKTLCLLSLPHFPKAADETHHPLQQADGYWHSLRSFRKGGRSWCLLWRWNISQIKCRGLGGVRHHPVSFPPRSVGTSQCTVFLPSICENLGLIPSPAKFDRAWEERRDFLCTLFVCLFDCFAHCHAVVSFVR